MSGGLTQHSYVLSLLSNGPTLLKFAGVFGFIRWKLEIQEVLQRTLKMENHRRVLQVHFMDDDGVRQRQADRFQSSCCSQIRVFDIFVYNS